MVDRVQVMKRESAALGGDDADAFPYPVPIAPQEDAIEAMGLYVQDASNRDETTFIWRDGSDLKFKDVNNSGGFTLTQLAAGTVDGSGTANQLAYWSDADTLTSSSAFTVSGTAMTVNGRGGSTSGKTGTFEVVGARSGSTTEFAAINLINYDDSGSDEEFVAGAILGFKGSSADSGRIEFQTTETTTGQTTRLTIEGDGDVTCANALTVGSAASAAAGALQWTGSNFQGYTGSAWVNLDTQDAVDGSGAANQVAYWSDSNTLTSSSAFTVSGSTLAVTAGTPTVWLKDTAIGAATLSRTMAGLQLSSHSMYLAASYTPAIKFMSTDPNLTEDPKLLALIVGRVTEDYDSNTKGGMALDFAVTGNTPGEYSVPTVAMTINHTGDTSFSGNVLASADDQYSLATNDLRWSTAYTTRLEVGDSGSINTDYQAYIRNDSSTGALLIGQTLSGSLTGVTKQSSRVQIFESSGVSGTADAIYGFSAVYVKSESTDNVDDVIMVRSALSATATGTFGRYVGFESQHFGTAALAITDAYGLYVNNMPGAFAVTNQYGIYLEDLDEGTGSSYGIWVEGAGTAAIYVNSGTTILSALEPKTPDVFNIGAAGNRWQGVYTNVVNVDTNYRLEINTNPQVIFDSTDRIDYIRASDRWNFVLANDTEVSIDATGIGIGIAGPTVELHIAKTNPRIRLEDTTSNAYSTIRSDDDGSILVSADNNTSGTSDTEIQLNIDNTRRVTILANGNFGIGVGMLAPEDLLHIEGSADPQFRITSKDDLEGAAGTENIGSIAWEGRRDTKYELATLIKARQDGTWSSVTANDSPSALAFYTQSSGGTDALVAPRMTIDSAGNVTLAEALQFDDENVKINRVTNDLTFYDTANSGGVTLSSLVSGFGDVSVGSGDAADRVAYWTDSNEISGSANFTWNGALKIAGNLGGGGLHLDSSTGAGIKLDRGDSSTTFCQLQFATATTPKWNVSLHPAADNLRIYDEVNDSTVMQFKTTEVVVNESQDDVNFRVESTNNTSLFFVDAGANKVAVGTNAPDGKLHVHAASAGTVDADAAADDLVVESNGATGITILSPNNNYGSVYFGDPDDATIGRIRYNHNNDKFLITTGAVTRMAIDGTGVGIGVNPAEDILHIEAAADPQFRITSTDDLEGTAGTENIGSIGFEGRRDTKYEICTQIKARQDGTWSDTTANDSPSALAFYTQSSGGTDALASPRMTIGSAGNVTLAEALQFDDEYVKIDRVTNDLTFYDTANSGGVTLSSLVSGSGDVSVGSGDVSPRVAYWSGSNEISGDANFTWDGSDLTVTGGGAVTGNLTVGDAVASSRTIIINANGGQTRNLRFRSAGSNRWNIRVNNTAESGSNAGSNFVLERYGDGVDDYLGNAITAIRSTGYVGIAGAAVTEALSVNGNIAVSGTVDGVNIDTLNTNYTNHAAEGTIHFTEASIDHGSIGGRDDDDHTQYALLAGRGTGQTLIGGTGASNSLTLQSTAHGTKGTVVFGTLSAYDQNTDRFGIGVTSPSSALHIKQAFPTIRLEDTDGTASEYSRVRVETDGSNDRLILGVDDGNASAGTSEICFDVDATRVATVKTEQLDVIGAGDGATYGRLRVQFTEGAHDLDEILGAIEFGHDSGSPDTTSAYIRCVHTRTGTGHTQDDAGLTFGTLNSTGSVTERIRIEHNGDVGVGTSDPDVRLHVYDTAEQVAVFENNQSLSKVGFRDSGSGGNAYAAIGSVGSVLALYANNGERVRIDSTGVKIADDNTAAASALHIKKSAPAIRFEDTDDPDGSYSIIHGSNTVGALVLSADHVGNSTGDSYVGFNVDGSRKVTIRESGRVGINESDPDVWLHVVKTRVSTPAFGTNEVAVFQHNDSTADICNVAIVAGTTGYSALLFGDTDAKDVGKINYSHQGDRFIFTVGGNSKMVIDSDGVGINVNPPTAALHVVADDQEINSFIFDGRNASTSTKQARFRLIGARTGLNSVFGNVEFYNYDTDGEYVGAEIRAVKDTASGTKTGRLELRSSTGGTATTHLTVESDGDVTCTNALTVGTSSTTEAGSIRYNSGSFEGRNASGWVNLGIQNEIDGSGATNELAYWSDADTLTSSSAFAVSGSTLAVTGSITVTGNVDGRDVSADGSTLDTHLGAASPHSGHAIIGTGDVSTQVAYWSADDTISGSANFTYDGTKLTIAGNLGGEGLIVDSTTGAGVKIDRADTSTTACRLSYATAGAVQWKIELNPDSNTLRIYDQSNTKTVMSFAQAGATIVNPAGEDRDFQVEGDTNPYMLFVDAGKDKVGIGTGTVNYATLVVEGASNNSNATSAVAIGRANAPVENISNYGHIYLFSTDDPPAADTGGNISFGGVWQDSSGSDTRWAAIAGLKENATDEDYDGYIGFYTRQTTVNYPEERMRIDSLGNVGINTTSIPHGGVGAAKLAIDGTDASENGPFVQFTTASDDHPLLQIMPLQHDNVQINFDAYWYGTGTWTSADAGSNFQIRKSDDALRFRYDSGVAQGGGVTWNEGLILDTSGRLGIGAAPSEALDVTGNMAVSGDGAVVGNLTVGDAVASSRSIVLNANAGQNRSLIYQSGSLDRWRITATNSAETYGTNEGSPLAISRYDDDGDYISNVVVLNRETGNVGIGGGTLDDLQLRVHGFVGIQKTTDAYSPTTGSQSGVCMNIYGSAGAWTTAIQDGNGRVSMLWNAYATSGGTWYAWKGGDKPVRLTISSTSELNYYVASAAPASPGDAVTWNDAAFTIDNAGNVGINNDDPSTQLDVDGVIATTDDLVVKTTLKGLRTNTADGNDNKFVRISGGGGYGYDRGALIGLGGNEQNTNPGRLTLVAGAGNATDGYGYVDIFTSDTLRVTVETDGDVTCAKALTVGAAASAAAGAIQWTDTNFQGYTGTEWVDLDAGQGNVDVGGSPSADQIAYWSDSDTVTGSASLTYASGVLHVVGPDGAGTLPSLAADTVGVFQNNDNASPDSALVSLIAGISGYSGFNFGDSGSETQGRILYYHNLDDLYFYTTGSFRMALDSDGNLGIGTNSPSVDLDIYRATNNESVRLQLGHSGTATSQFVDINLATKTNGSVVGTATVTQGWRLIAYGDAYATTSVQNHLRLLYWDGSSSNDAMYVDPDGNIGMGAAVPKAKLHVVGPDGTTQGTPTFNDDVVTVFQNNGATTDGCMICLIGGQTGDSKIFFGDKDSAITGRIEYDHAFNLMDFWANSTRILTVDGPNSRVGIMYPSPDCALHVYEDLKVQSSSGLAGPTVTIDQNDEDEAFIDYQGTSASDYSKNISTSDGTGAVDGPHSGNNDGGWIFTGMVKVEINGTPYWMPYYADEDPPA